MVLEPKWLQWALIIRTTGHLLEAQAFVPHCLFCFKTLIQKSTHKHKQAKLLAVYVATETTHLGKILRQINEPWFPIVSLSPHKQQKRLKSQKPCNTNKLTRVSDEDIMLLPNKLHSFWLPTRSHEGDSVAPSVEDFYSFSQFVELERKIKTLGCFLLLRVLKKNFTMKSSKVWVFHAQCYPVKLIVLQIKAL